MLPCRGAAAITRSLCSHHGPVLLCWVYSVPSNQPFCLGLNPGCCPVGSASQWCDTEDVMDQELHDQGTALPERCQRARLAAELPHHQLKPSWLEKQRGGSCHGAC